MPADGEHDRRLPGTQPRMRALGRGFAAHALNIHSVRDHHRLAAGDQRRDQRIAGERIGDQDKPIGACGHRPELPPPQRPVRPAFALQRVADAQDLAARHAQPRQRAEQVPVVASGKEHIRPPPAELPPVGQQCASLPVLALLLPGPGA